MTKKVIVAKAKHVREGYRILTERGWLLVTDSEPWFENGSIKVTFDDGDWETFAPKERVVMMR